MHISNLVFGVFYSLYISLVVNGYHAQVEGKEDQYAEVVKVLQDMFEVVTNDMMRNGSRFVLLFLVK